jgi:hypothetical protein
MRCLLLLWMLLLSIGCKNAVYEIIKPRNSGPPNISPPITTTTNTPATPAPFPDDPDKPVDPNKQPSTNPDTPTIDPNGPGGPDCPNQIDCRLQTEECRKMCIEAQGSICPITIFIIIMSGCNCEAY